MAVYSFIYKEIIVPKSAPINISLNLSLQKSGTSDDRGAKFKKPIDAILLKIGAKNPSSRSVCLLPSYFIAYGYKMSDNHLSDERFVKGAGDNPMVYKEGVFLTKHLTVAKTSVVALGNLIEDEVLKPNEQVENSYIFYTPQGEYDFIEVFAAIPSVSMKARGKIGFGLVYNSIGHRFG